MLLTYIAENHNSNTIHVTDENLFLYDVYAVHIFLQVIYESWFKVLHNFGHNQTNMLRKCYLLSQNISHGKFYTKKKSLFRVLASLDVMFLTLQKFKTYSSTSLFRLLKAFVGKDVRLLPLRYLQERIRQTLLSLKRACSSRKG